MVNFTFFLISDDEQETFESNSSFRKKTYIKKPKKRISKPIDPGFSTIKSFYNDEPYTNEIPNQLIPKSEHIRCFPKKEPLISDEEEQLLLTPSKTNSSEHSVEQQASFGSNKEKASAYFLMFCNICRSFIAIGVLAVPYGLSKCGNFIGCLMRRNSFGLWFHHFDHFD